MTPSAALRLLTDIALGAVATAAAAQDIAAPVTEGKRPAINLTRWREDWTPLADPALRNQPLDTLKHISLSTDPGDFISLGLNIRERYEHQDANFFGTVAKPGDYLLNRLQAHVDLRVHDHFEAFVQLEEVTAPGLARPGPADVNKGDLRQAFVAYRGRSGDWRYGLRVGRQEIGFDLERFVSIREGPNVRQAFDAIWAEADYGQWSFRALASHPVQYRPGSFDDVSNRHLAFHAFRIERHAFGPGDLSAYVAHYTADGDLAGLSSGRERRDIVDVRYFKPAGRWQYDVEFMYQGGDVAGRDVEAWAVGARTRYLLDNGGWLPKIGVQVDAASGDTTPAGNRVRRFNPLFPNGIYFTQAGYTGYTNLVHVKPTLTVDPGRDVTLLAGVGLQWRETTRDAVYVQPSIPVPGTAGLAGRYTGTYVQGRADWRVTPNIRSSLEAVYFSVAEPIRQAGGRDAKYVAVEAAYAF